MRRSIRGTLLLFFAIGAVVASPSATAIQDDQSRPPGPEALALLPAVAAFGDGWSSPAAPVRFVPADAFRDGVLVAFGGPGGARVVVVALLATDERVAIRASWEEAGKLYDRYRHDLTYDDGLADALADTPPPPGCAEAKRIEGIGERDAFSAGVTLCAVDPDAILLAVASGPVLGATGTRASDAVIATALDQRATGPLDPATPAPVP